MPEHTVSQGECLSSIAYAHGFFWETLWNLPENRELRELRGDPNVLREGDVVFIPPLRSKEVGVETDLRHRFRLRGVPAQFRLRLLRDGVPRSGEPYSLEIGGETFEGETDEEGWIVHPIPPDATEGTLRLSGGTEEYSLRLGQLNPMDESDGIQQRLRNLGLYRGEVDGQANPSTEAALRRFQKQRGLEPTGTLDEATRQALTQVHES